MLPAVKRTTPLAPLAPLTPLAPQRRNGAPSAIHFPEEATVPEHKRHLDLRTLLYLVLGTLTGEHTVGSEQFVYWDPKNAKRCVSPDAFVLLGVPDTVFGSWKTWERGVPDVAVEIVSASDSGEKTWAEKLQDYRDLGVKHLVRFDPDAREGQRLRIWERGGGDLVERELEDDRGACEELGMHWVVVPAGRYPAALRLAWDPEGHDLVLTPEEVEARARRAEARARRAANRALKAAQARADGEARAREAAERRIAELEAKLRRLGG